MQYLTYFNIFLTLSYLYYFYLCHVKRNKTISMSLDFITSVIMDKDLTYSVKVVYLINGNEYSISSPKFFRDVNDAFAEASLIISKFGVQPYKVFIL